MLGFVQGLGNTDYEITVLSGNPEETYKQYGLPSVNRRDFKQIDAAIAACDALVFPGGSIFQDVTSVKSVAYYQKLVKMAKSANKKVVLIGQGVGPLTSFIGKRLASSAFGMADAIAVRDPGSLETLKSIGITKNVRVTADLAFLLPPPVENPDHTEFGVGGMKSVGIAPRAVANKKIDVAALFGEFCRLLYKSGSMPVLIEMDKNEDGALILEISKRQGGKIPDLKRIQTPMQLQQRLNRMDAIVAMRLHAGILAATVGIPPIMVSYDPKVAAFSKMLDVGPALPMEGLTAARMLDTFLASQKDRERNEKILERKFAELYKSAQLNIELVHDTMGSIARR